MSRYKKNGLNNTQRQRISDRVLILTLFVQILILVNQSVGLYTVAAQSMQASIIEPTGETLQVHIQTDTGRLNLVEKLIKGVRDWTSSYFVGGVERTNAETGITISVTGSNVASTAYVDYYIEAVPQSGGAAYRFLEGNNTAITVGGSALSPSNQTSIENHLTAMGLSTTASHTIDYYVYVKAEATGAVSGETLTSEITYTKFDTVTYQYGVEVTENIDPDLDGYLMLSDSNSTSYDFTYTTTDYCGMYYGNKYRYLGKFAIDPGSYTEAELHLYEYSCGGVGEPVTWDLYSCQPFYMVDQWSANFSGWWDQPTDITWLDDVSISSNAAGHWRVWTSSTLVTYVNQRAGDYAYFKIYIDAEDFATQHLNGGFEDSYSSRSNDPHLEVTYLSYESSWYPLPPLSLAQLPITLDLAALATLFFVTSYAIKTRRKQI